MSSTLNDTIDLETTAEILDRIAGGKEAYEELPNRRQTRNHGGNPG